MLNKLRDFFRQYDLLRPGEKIVCAVSGGADSIALLWAMYLLRDEAEFELSAAHFNHRLRGPESDRDEQFVRDFCAGYGIPLTVGSAEVVPDKKGLEAAARDARYAFLRTLPGWIATAHTADDNAETVLMHLVRGTGLKGLGGITPVNGRVIRPMLGVTRRQVEAFLEEYHVDYITDSSNETDAYLRNRLRHLVMPLLAAENPKLAENLSAMALRLRQDEEALSALADAGNPPDVELLRAMAPAVRVRALERFLKNSGVREPEAPHIALAEALVFSDKPSAKADFPGGVTISRQYGLLTVLMRTGALPETVLHVGESLQWGDYRICCREASEIVNTPDTITVNPRGDIRIRSRQPGDEIRLPGGTKSLKKLFIDRKIQASERPLIPVAADDEGILGVGSIGVNLNRAAPDSPALQIQFQKVVPSES